MTKTSNLFLACVVASLFLMPLSGHAALLPDLTASNVSGGGAGIGSGTFSMTFTASISNTGGSTATTFPVLFQFAATNSAGTPITGGLASGATAQSSGTFSGFRAGTDAGGSVRACADLPDNVVSESNENNNCSSWVVVECQYISNYDACYDIPNSCPGTLNGASTQCYTYFPDYVVPNAPTIASGGATGQATTFTAVVQNAGAADATVPSNVRFQLDVGADGTYDTTLDAIGSPIPPLAQGQSASATSPAWTAGAGTYKIRACADMPPDSPGFVAESNENNNCGPDLAFTVNSATPTASLAVSPSSIFAGDSAQLSWGSTNATSCTGTNFSTGNATSGTLSVSPRTTTTYSVFCSNATGNSPTQSATLGVNAPPPPSPTATLTANPSTITAGDSSTLTWGSKNATSCTGSGFNTANATGGSVSVTPSSTTSYSVTCTGTGGSAFASATITVNPNPNPNTGTNGGSCTLTSSPTTINLGDSVQFTWSCGSDISSCQAIGSPAPFDTGGAPNNNGTPKVVATPTQTGTVSYGISCMGKSASATTYASVLVKTPSVTIKATPARVRQGDASALAWSGTDVTSCTVTDSTGATLAQGRADNNGNFSIGSPFTVRPTSQTTYTITCQTGGTPPTTTASAVVNVVPVFIPF